VSRETTGQRHRQVTREGRRLRRTVACLLPVLVLFSACSSGGPKADPAAKQPPQAATQQVPSVPLGTTQAVVASNAFGPGTGDVPIHITVYAFRDHVAPGAGIRPITPATHWASADILVCRSKPVVFDYPAWVLEAADGRVAQTTKVQHPQFPQPAFPNASTKAGCARGWVTWVTPDSLTGHTINFEQTHDLPGPWRLH